MKKNHDMNQQALFTMPDPFNGEAGAIESSILAHVNELDAAGMLYGKTKATCITLLYSARAVDRELCAGKLTVAATNMVKQILESLDKLPEPQRDTGGVFDTLDAMISALTKEALANEMPEA